MHYTQRAQRHDCFFSDLKTGKRKNKTRTICSSGPLRCCGRKQCTLTALCRVHGCKDWILKRILQENIKDEESKCAHQRVWQAYAEVPLCEVPEKINFWPQKCKKFCDFQEKCTKLNKNNTNKLIQKVLSAHPAGYSYASYTQEESSGARERRVCKQRGSFMLLVRDTLEPLYSEETKLPKRKSKPRTKGWKVWKRYPMLSVERNARRREMRHFGLSK